jgi:hypothetical protein
MAITVLETQNLRQGLLIHNYQSLLTSLTTKHLLGSE